jgi:ribosome-binding protein aMBF1 (putative translation factor)
LHAPAEAPDKGIHPDIIAQPIFRKQSPPTRCDNYLEVLGKTIAECRKKKGFSQKELAAKTGLSLSSIKQIEMGKMGKSFFRISDALDLAITFAASPD